MNKSKAACLLTIKKLCELENANETYLHTLTFPEPEPDVREAARRFHNFFSGTGAGRSLVVRAVWALQRGDRTRRLHFHLVTTRRVDAAAMWRALPKYGFGIYHVSDPEPSHRAAYVARYVGRPGHLETGTRSWGAIGFPKVLQGNVEGVTRTLTRVTPPPRWVLHAWFRAKLNQDNYAKRVAFIQKHWDEIIVEKDMSNTFGKKLNETQLAELAQDAQSGTYAVFVGEYRGFTITTRENKDKLSGVMVESNTVQHVVMVGTETLKVNEYLPPGASPDNVKVPAQQGETVIVRVSSWQKNQFGTSIRGFIKPLTQLGLIPAGAPVAPKK